MGAVLVVHMALILGLTGTLEWRLQTAEPVRVAPMQTRWVPPTPAPTVTPPPSRHPQAPHSGRDRAQSSTCTTIDPSNGAFRAS